MHVCAVLHAASAWLSMQSPPFEGVGRGRKQEMQLEADTRGVSELHRWAELRASLPPTKSSLQVTREREESGGENRSKSNGSLQQRTRNT